MQGYVPVRTRNWTFCILPELAEPAFAALCCLPQGYCPEGITPVVSSENTEVRRFGYQERNYFLKEYFFLGWKKHLKLFGRGERLVRVARLLSEHGFLTPRVVGVGRSGGNRRVVTEAVEDARDVWQVLYPDFKRHRSDIDDGFLQVLGHTIGNLHRCGFYHGDLRWRNILTQLDKGKWKIYFIDNDRTRRFKWGIPLRCRVKNLSQVLFSGLLLDWPPHEWQLFLRSYLERSGLHQSLHDRLIGRVEKIARKRLEKRQNKNS